MERSGSGESVKVNIYGSTFYLRSKDETDKQYLISIAQHVDDSMKAIAEESKITNITRLAILAALNLADELHSGNSKTKQVEESTAERVRGLCEMLDGELADITSAE